MELFTIGYEGSDIDQFMSVLIETGIEKVVDVRELPLSRKPGFSKNRLLQRLESVGIEYVHIAALGCPRIIRNRYRIDHDWARYSESFLQYLSLQDKSLAELALLSILKTSALLCFERDYRVCHRSMVASAVRSLNDLIVTHLEVPNIKIGYPVSIAETVSVGR